MQQDLVKKNKEELEKMKRELKEILQDIATKDKHVADDYDTKYQDFGDPIFDDSAEAAEVALYQDNLSVEANLEVKLQAVDHALKRIEDGSYGKCVKCEGEISDERLKAQPAAKMCIDCARK